MLNNFCAKLKCYTAAAAAAGGTDGSIGIFTTIARLPRRLASGGAAVVACKFLTFGPNVSGGPSFSLSGALSALCTRAANEGLPRFHNH